MLIRNIWIAGSNPNRGLNLTDHFSSEFRAEYLNPPYMNVPRPVLLNVPTKLPFNHVFTVNVQIPKNLKPANVQVALMDLGFSSHAFHASSRLVYMNATLAPNLKSITIVTPPNNRVYPPGPAMRRLSWLRTSLLGTLRGSMRQPKTPLLRPISTAAAAACRQNVTLPNIPELYDPQFLDILLPLEQSTSQSQRSSSDSETTPAPASAHEESTNAMVEALKTTADQTLTENLAPTYSSTGSATLDAFQMLSSAWDISDFDHYLKKSWDEDPELTLRIIWNIRSIHDGRSDQRGFYTAFGWLLKYHPRTAIENLHMLVKQVCRTQEGTQGMSHGYWKDLLNIVTLAALDRLHTLPSAAPQSSIDKWRKAKKRAYRKSLAAKDGYTKLSSPTDLKNSKMTKERLAETTKENRAVIAVEHYDNLVEKLKCRKFRALYIAVARLFSSRLVRDLQIRDSLSVGDLDTDRMSSVDELSLAGKWAPTPMGSHDRVTNLATAISKLIHHSDPSLKFPSALSATNPLNPVEESIILRSFYQRWILTPLRSTLRVTETLMSSKRWDQIQYKRVPSVCMRNNSHLFFAHDEERFDKYLTAVEGDRDKISGATLLPHQLISEIARIGGYIEKDDSRIQFNKRLYATQVRVIEAQWKTLIQRLRESGSIDNALAICDVSGSMYQDHSEMEGTPHSIPPIYPAISLSLILASLAKPPFNAGFITFSQDPKFVKLDLENRSLVDTVKTMSDADWGMNTDFDAVFLKLLLPLAVRNKVAKEDMIKRLFVFSDMQFDQAIPSSSSTLKDPANWKTNHDVVEEMYKALGYEVPQIVYWDLAQYGTTEVKAEREGVALMNGFSPAMMKVFMGDDLEGEGEGEGELEQGEKGIKLENMKQHVQFNPLVVMKKALAKESFDGLVVVD
ncbi:hypothetical protein H0H93_001335 [Arthromyces matolae]|nr:hypothetical protein H0H93_001335 [Arthromyces matolae]